MHGTVDLLPASNLFQIASVFLPSLYSKHKAYHSCIMSATSSYTTRLSSEEYDTSSTIGVMVWFNDPSKIAFSVETDERKTGGTDMAKIVRKYLTARDSEVFSLTNCEPSYRGEVINSIARRIIAEAKQEQSWDDRQKYPLKPYVIIKEGGKNVFVDISEYPDSDKE